MKSVGVTRDARRGRFGALLPTEKARELRRVDRGLQRGAEHTQSRCRRWFIAQQQAGSASYRTVIGGN